MLLNSNEQGNERIKIRYSSEKNCTCSHIDTRKGRNENVHKNEHTIHYSDS